MSDPKQGEIWMADLPPPLNRRPVLVLTRSGAIPALYNVTIATVSSRIRAIATEVELTPEDGLAERCAVSADNLLTFPKHYLDDRVCQLSAERINQVFEAIHVALDMPF